MPLKLPRSLSPSKASSFTDCPLAFRLSIIDRLPEPPSAPAVKGTLVHSALEGLFWNHPVGERTKSAAADELAAAWSAIQEDHEFAALGLGDDEAASFLRDAEGLLANYFTLEDPNAVRAVAVELGLEIELGNMRLRGIIDRLDVNENGDFVVIDYKSGRAPSVRYEHARMAGVHIYALLCERILGRAPVEVRLLHLADPVAIVAVPTEQSIRGQRQRMTAVWQAIERACSREDFRPRPGPLCNYCNFQAFCPAYGGAPPVVAAS